MNQLCSTKEASLATGLSIYELRKGAKTGKYPCLICGSEESKFRKIKWNIPVLLTAIEKQMTDGINQFNEA